MSKEKTPSPSQKEGLTSKQTEKAISLRKKIGEKATALQDQTETGKHLGKTRRAIKQHQLKRAEQKAQKHFERNKGAYQEEAQKIDTLNKRANMLLKASPEDMALIALSLGSTVREADTIMQHRAEGHSVNKTAASAKERGIDALKKVPGIDPVLAVADGNPQDIPKSGWLVTSRVDPGYGGIIEVFKFGEGQLKIKPPLKDTRNEYGELRVSLAIDGELSHTLAYENPSFPNKDTEPYERMSATSYVGLSFADMNIVPLSNGGRLLDEAQNSPGRLMTTVDWRDSDSEYASCATINRVVGDYDELAPVLIGISDGMGLETQDIETLTATISQKINPSQA